MATPCRHSGESRNPACGLLSWTLTFVRVTNEMGRGIKFLLTTFLDVCISSASAPEGGGHREASPLQVDTWSSCRLSQGPRGTLAGTDGGGSAVGPPLFSPPAGGRQTHSVNPSKLTEVGTRPTLRSRHLGGPASHLSFTPRRCAGGGVFLLRQTG